MDNYFHWLILALVLATTQTGNAQDIGLRLEEPAQMNARLPELYRVYITNNTAESQSCYVLLRVQEADDGVIGIIRSAPFEVPPGGKTLNAGNFSQLEPLEVQQANPDYESFVLRPNTLPPGSYNICMTLFLETTGEAIAKDCYKAENESFTPPYLLAPQNETVINEEQPFFNWSPASPAPASGSFNYMLLITEMQQGQSPVAAIKSNRPWFLRKNITTPVFQ